MFRRILFVVLTLLASWTSAADVPNVLLEEPPKRFGILVLDNCDATYKGKAEYTDNLTLLNSKGGQQFRITGFNSAKSRRFV